MIDPDVARISKVFELGLISRAQAVKALALTSRRKSCGARVAAPLDCAPMFCRRRRRIEVRLDEIMARLTDIQNQIQTTTTTITTGDSTIMSNLDDLAAKANELTDTVAAARLVLDGLRADLAAALADDDPAAVQAIVDQLDGAIESLAAGIASPGNPEPTPEPEPEPTPDAPAEGEVPSEPSDPEVAAEG